MLEHFLNTFDYSLFPDGTRQYAYSTDLVQCFPSTSDGKTRPPTTSEAENCAHWMEDELALVKPQVLVLLGLRSTKAFFRRYLGQKVNRLGDVPGRHLARIAGLEVNAFAISHPSPLAARQSREEDYAMVANEIKALLAGKGALSNSQLQAFNFSR